MKINVQTLGGRFTLDVEPTDTIDIVKQKFFEAEQGAPHDKATLIFCGNALRDGDRTLAQLNIQRESTLHLLLFRGARAAASSQKTTDTASNDETTSIQT